jgi:hypothetical protein
MIIRVFGLVLLVGRLVGRMTGGHVTALAISIPCRAGRSVRSASAA